MDSQPETQDPLSPIFEITVLAAGLWPSIRITADEFKLAKAAKKQLVIALGIEDKLDILLENYAEYERELLDLSLGDMLFRSSDWSSFMSDMQKVNRRLSNLLSAGRLYLDQVKHDLSGIYGSNSNQHKELKTSLSQEYDNNQGYRVMEALRNHMQHRSLPIQKLSYTRQWENREQESKPRLRHCTVPALDVKQIREEGGFKTAVLEELEQMGEEFLDITPFARQYVESIGRAHEALRSRLKSDVESWEQTLLSLIERAQGPLEGKLTGLGLVARRPDETYIEAVHLSKDLIKRRRTLERKNSSLSSLSFRYVAGSRKVEGDRG